jgi:Uma2 family endonuclease
MPTRSLAEPSEADTLADLLERLGDVPLNRIRMHPAPGTATEEDVVVALEAMDKRLCELVDGVLVEKAMGTKESLLAGFILHRLHVFLDEHDLGLPFGADGAMRLMKGLVRIPDVSFVSWQRLPEGVPDEPIAGLVPDLAVEVLSRSNTKGETRRKLRDYFLAGGKLAWLIQPRTETAEVYRAPDRKKRVGKAGTLDGGDVLPGFRISLQELFARANRKPGVKRKREKQGE